MDIYEKISVAGADEIGDILDSVLFRYRELYPNWELSVVSIDKTIDKKEQLNEIIKLLANMKE